MGTEINAIVQKYLAISNLDGNQIIDKNEIRIFENALSIEVSSKTITAQQAQEAIFNTVKTMGSDDLKEEYGLDTVKVSNPIENSPKVPIYNHDGQAQSRAFKHVQNIVNDALKDGNISLDDFIANIEKKVGKLNQDTRYTAPFIERIKYIKDNYFNELTSYEISTDIDEAHEQIVKAMAQDEYKGLKLGNAYDLDLLDALETVAKREIAARTSAEITNAFNDLKVKETNLEAAVKSLEKRLTANGTVTLNKDQKAALKNIKTTVAKENALVTMTPYLNEINIDTKLLDKFELPAFSLEVQTQEVSHATQDAIKEAKRQVKEKLKEAGLWDEYTKDIHNSKQFRKIVETAIQNKKVEYFKTKYTAEEIKDELNSNKRPLFEALQAKGLIEPIEGSDKYDISKLSALIGEIIGADDVANRTSSKFKTIKEKKVLMSELKVLLESNMKDSDRNKLVKLCGYKNEGINWVKVLANGATFGLYDAVETGVLAARNAVGQSVIIPGDVLQIIGKVNITQLTNVDVIVNSLKELGLESLIEVNSKQETFIDFGKLHQFADQLINLPADKRTAIHAAYQAGALGAALGALNGARSTEIPRTVIDFTCKSYDEYVKFLKEHHGNKDYVKGLTLLAAKFIDENGNWNCKAYQDYLASIAGRASVLNKEELGDEINNEYLKITKPEKETPIIEEQEQEQEQNDFEPEMIELKAGTCVGNCTTQEKDYDIKDARRSSWPKVLEQYDGCLEKTFGGKYNAIRVLKIVQAITDGNYSEERLKHLLNESKKGLSHMKNIPGLDYDTYYDFYKATTMSEKLKLPHKIGDCDLLNKDIEKASLNENEILKKGEDGYKEAGNAKIGTVNDRKTTYWTKLGNGDIITYTDESIWNNYLKDYEEAQDVIIKKNLPCEDKE